MNKRKKILIFTPGGVGGAERMSVLIGKLLPRDRFDVTYVVIGRLKNIYNIMPEGYDVDCIPVCNIYAFSTLRIWKKIVWEKPDIVFTSQEAYNGRVIIASKLAGCKVVARSSNMIGKYKRRLLRQVKFIYPKANLLIAQQDEMRVEMLDILKVSREKIVTLHNPLDTSDIDALSNAPSPFPNDGSINFVNVARVVYNKSQDVSVKAFVKVKKVIPIAKLYFVGGYNENDDYYKQLIEEIQEFGLVDSVVFVGYDKNPYKWVKNADCFILPSRVEGLPNALIEASYLGVPCVAARCLDIVDDIVKDGQNGYVVDMEDVNGLSHAMIEAVKLKECNMVYKPGSAEAFIKVFESI